MCVVWCSDAGLFVYGCDLSSTAIQLLRVSYNERDVLGGWWNLYSTVVPHPRVLLKLLSFLSLYTTKSFSGIWHITTYLLLVTCGWRAWKLNSFKCPTRCSRRDASWRSTQTQFLRYEMIRSFTAIQLCCWRRTFECPIAIDSSLISIFVLVCYNTEEMEEMSDRYFLCP